MKKYIVIYTDFGDSCDYKARLLGVYNTFKKAEQEMSDDVHQYIESNEDSDIHTTITEEYDDSVLVGDQGYGCQWQILEVEV